MTTNPTAPSAAAIEAAARALAGDDSDDAMTPTWDDADPDVRDGYLALAEDALTTALPLLSVPEVARAVSDRIEVTMQFGEIVRERDEAVAQVETLQQSNDHLRIVVETWSDLYREAVGLPAEEHARRRVEQMAEAVEQAQMETAAVRRLLLAASTPVDDAPTKPASVLDLPSNAPTIVSTCWCGGSIGERTPGDPQGLGCLADITHATARTPDDDAEGKS